MSQKELLKLAMIGVCHIIKRENEINLLTIEEYGHENNISLHNIEKLEKQFTEIMNLIAIEEGVLNKPRAAAIPPIKELNK